MRCTARQAPPPPSVRSSTSSPRRAALAYVPRARMRACAATAAPIVPRGALPRAALSTPLDDATEPEEVPRYEKYRILWKTRMPLSAVKAKMQAEDPDLIASKWAVLARDPASVPLVDALIEKDKSLGVPALPAPSVGVQ